MLCFSYPFRCYGVYSEWMPVFRSYIQSEELDVDKACKHAKLVVDYVTKDKPKKDKPVTLGQLRNIYDILLTMKLAMIKENNTNTDPYKSLGHIMTFLNEKYEM